MRTVGRASDDNPNKVYMGILLSFHQVSFPKNIEFHPLAIFLSSIQGFCSSEIIVGELMISRIPTWKVFLESQFGNVPTSMLSLFQLMATPNLMFYEPLFDQYPGANKPIAITSHTI